MAAVVSIPLPLDRLPEEDLPRASHQARAEQHENVPPRAGMLGGVQQVGAGAAPHQALHDFQQPGQRRRGYARADTGEQHRQPEAAPRRDGQAWRVSHHRSMALETTSSSVIAAGAA